MIPCACARRNFGPGRARPPRGGTEASGPEQGPDRRRSHPDAELAELALDPHATPARVLPGQPEDERTDFRVDGRPSRAPAPTVGPLPPHELAVPPKEGRRG